MTRAQLAVLRKAARASGPAVADELRNSDEDRLEVICRQDLTVVFASGSELSRLRRAFGRVYARLEGDRLTGQTLGRIRQIAARLAESTEVVGCDEQAAPSAASIPDGTYEVTVTPRDALRGGIAPDDPIVEQGVAHFTLELDKGNYTVVNVKDPDPGEGTYSVFRDRIEFTGIDGSAFTARWSFADGRLRFEDVSVPGSARGSRYARVMWSSHPWTKLR